MEINYIRFQKCLLGMIGLMALPCLPVTDASEPSPMKPETITLSNPACEAVICVKPFVHLISFRFIGGKNHLLNFETPNPGDLRPQFIVGAKLWYAPEVSGSHLFGLLSGSITRNGGDLNAQLDPDPGSGLQGRIHFHLDEHEPRITITSVLQNVGTVEKETSCWWPVSFEPGGRMEAVPMPMPAEPAFNFHFWSYGGPPTEPACQITKTKVVLDLDRRLQESIYKIGFMGKEILLTKDDCAYRVTALDPVPSPKRTYPHGGSPVMLYCDQKTGFCEAEVSGPLKKLGPNEETSFTFSIVLERPVND